MRLGREEGQRGIIAGVAGRESHKIFSESLGFTLRNDWKALSMKS